MSKGKCIVYRLSIIRELSLLRDPELNQVFDAVAINGNIAAYHDSLISEYIMNDSPAYFVDPMTYAFQFPQRFKRADGAVKLSFKELAKKYGSPFSDCVEGRGKALNLDSFNEGGSIDTEKCRVLLKNIIEFEKNSKGDGQAHRQSSLDEITMLAGIALPTVSWKMPIFIVPPYFCANDFDGWYDLSLTFATECANLEKEMPVLPVISISSSMIKKEEGRDRIVKDYGKFPGVLFWINDFDETKVGTPDLFSLISLVVELRKTEMKVISLYGGYFSWLLRKVGLSAVVSGICYNDYRNAQAPASTGGGKLRYYVPEVRKKLPLSEAGTFYSGVPEFDCMCKFCKEARGGMTPDIWFINLNQMESGADDIVRKHFMTCRKEETKEIDSLDLNDILSLLGKQIDTLGKSIDVTHLSSWKIAFEQFIDSTKE